MNGPTPGIRRSAPAGGGGATSAGVGIRTAARDALAWARRIRNLPARPETAASPAAPAPARRNRRRSNDDGGIVSGSAALVAGAPTPAARRSHRNVASPATVATIDGTAAARPFPGRATAAAAPT